MTWICPKCNAKLIGNNNGYTIIGSDRKHHYIKCQKCNTELQLLLMGKSIFEEIHYDEPAYREIYNADICKGQRHDLGNSSGGTCKRCGHFEPCG